jgi:fructan beta-fructosidase
MVYGNGGPYSIGKFDGARFTVEHGPFIKQSGQACQTWSGAPEGRRIELGLLGRVYGLPTMGIQTLPVEITLRTLPDGSIRAFKNPIRELESLRSATLVNRAEETLNPGTITLATVKDDLLDIIAEFEVDEAALKAGVKIFFNYRGRLGGYDATKPKIHDLELKPLNGKIKMRIVVDRAVHEAFYNDGLIYQTAMHECRDPKPDRTLRLEVASATVKLNRLEVHELGKAGWKPFSSRQLIETAPGERRK